MEKLLLDVKDLSEYRIKKTHLYAKEGTKELRLTFCGGMQVWKEGVKVFEHNQPYAVIEFFNNLD